MTDTAMLPCPFCANTEKVLLHTEPFSPPIGYMHHESQVRCKECCACGPIALNTDREWARAEAVRLWNAAPRREARDGE